MVRLDGRMTSELNWSEATQKVKDSKGPICWEINLGLFNALKLPLSNEMQFRSLGVSLSQFTDEIYPEFIEREQKLILYHGKICQADELEYLESLTLFLPKDLSVKVILDAGSIDCPLEFAKRSVLFDHDQIEVSYENAPYPIYENTKIGVAIPTDRKVRVDRIREGLKYLIDQKIPFRTLNENYMTDQWHELDLLIIESEELDNQKDRMLQGFLAAGGEVLLFDNFREDLHDAINRGVL